MSTELATTRQTAIDPYSPRSFEGAWELAQIVVKSRMNGSIQTTEAAFMVMALGNDMGLSVSQSLRGIQVIEGKACPSADCLVACVIRSGLAEYIVEVETNEDHSTWETKRKGEAKPRRSTFSMADAERAKLTSRGKDPSNSNWAKYPKRMLSARAKAFLVRDVYPDFALGLYTPEEIQDVSAEREPIRTQVVVESVAPAPVQERVAPPWAHALAEANDVKALRDVANALTKEGVPHTEIKPLFDARLAEIRSAEAAQ